MSAHTPSANSGPYKLLRFYGDEVTTQIDFVLPNVRTELVRCGLDARVDADGWTIRPGRPQPTVVQTYDDHRMAMSFSLLGLGAPGIAIADPACVAKTFPGYWALLDQVSPGALASAAAARR